LDGPNPSGGPRKREVGIYASGYFEATEKLTSNFDEFVRRTTFSIEREPHKENLHRDVNALGAVRNS
jgi:hypothetical protein